MFSRAQQPVPQQTRSRLQLILDDLDVAYKRLDHAVSLFNSLILDTDKAMKFIDQFRIDLAQAIEEGGGTVKATDPGNIEAQIKEIFAGRTDAR